MMWFLIGGYFGVAIWLFVMMHKCDLAAEFGLPMTTAVSLFWPIVLIHVLVSR